MLNTTSDRAGFVGLSSDTDCLILNGKVICCSLPGQSRYSSPHYWFTASYSLSPQRSIQDLGGGGRQAPGFINRKASLDSCWRSDHRSVIYVDRWWAVGGQGLLWGVVVHRGAIFARFVSHSFENSWSAPALRALCSWCDKPVTSHYERWPLGHSSVIAVNPGSSLFLLLHHFGQIFIEVMDGCSQHRTSFSFLA